MEEALQVNLLYSGDRLVGDKEDRLERELSAAVVEQVLERRAESVNDQSVELALLPEPSDSRDSDPAVQRVVCLLLFSERLGVISNERKFIVTSSPDERSVPARSATAEAMRDSAVPE